MRIILEGCDGTGKSTLAKKLQQHYGIDYVHVTRGDPTTFGFYFNTLDKVKIVWDRHFIGEMIYPAVFGRMQRLTQRDFEILLDKARVENVVILVLTVDPQQLMINNDRPEYEEVKKNLNMINDKFVTIANIYQIPVINTFKQSFEDIIKIIEEQYENNKQSLL